MGQFLQKEKRKKIKEGRVHNIKKHSFENTAFEDVEKCYVIQDFHISLVRIWGIVRIKAIKF